MFHKNRVLAGAIAIAFLLFLVSGTAKAQPTLEYSATDYELAITLGGDQCLDSQAAVLSGSAADLANWHYFYGSDPIPNPQLCSTWTPIDPDMNGSIASRIAACWSRCEDNANRAVQRCVRLRLIQGILCVDLATVKWDLCNEVCWITAGMWGFPPN